MHRDLAGHVDDFLAGWHAHLDLLVAEAEGWALARPSQAYAAAGRLYAQIS